MDNCIFCMIAEGKVPSRKVYEDDDILAFDDIAPQAPVHTLVIPKKHYNNMSDDVGLVALGTVFGVVPKIAEMKGVAQAGYRVIVNNGIDANQTVGHLHVHILGGRKMAQGMVTFDGE
ncbi:MAG: histidine triad nucleotide-binding protein [Coriobacteriia bacterium]|nr:histidine triad nucleotide-binding protein [Coriobacteriia bacterium]